MNKPTNRQIMMHDYVANLFSHDLKCKVPDEVTGLLPLYLWKSTQSLNWVVILFITTRYRPPESCSRRQVLQVLRSITSAGYAAGYAASWLRDHCHEYKEVRLYCDGVNSLFVFIVLTVILTVILTGPYSRPYLMYESASARVISAQEQTPRLSYWLAVGENLFKSRWH